MERLFIRCCDGGGGDCGDERINKMEEPETSCQGLFNQIHEKVTNERLFFARTSLLSPAHGI